MKSVLRLPLIVLGAVVVLSLTFIRPVSSEDMEVIPGTGDVKTFCNHGNRVYMKVGTMGITTLAVVQGCDIH